MKQLSMKLSGGGWGGLRPNSGRKRIHSKGVAHRSREQIDLKKPCHINFKYRKCIRNKDALLILKRAILNARRQGLNVIHYSMQSNHIHIIVEAPDNAILTSGMRSLTVTFAKGLKMGRIQVERYHLHVLKTLKETKNALSYVLFNEQKHGKGTYGSINCYSSIFSLKNPYMVIRNFALKSKITLKIEGHQSNICYRPISYLLKKAELLL